MIWYKLMKRIWTELRKIKRDVTATVEASNSVVGGMQADWMEAIERQQ